MPKDDDVTTQAGQEPQIGGRRIAAARLALDAANQVVDLDTNETLAGIVTFGARVTAPAPEESPITTMQHWSDSRQGAAKPTR